MLLPVFSMMYSIKILKFLFFASFLRRERSIFHRYGKACYPLLWLKKYRLKYSNNYINHKNYLNHRNYLPYRYYQVYVDWSVRLTPVMHTFYHVETVQARPDGSGRKLGWLYILGRLSFNEQQDSTSRQRTFTVLS